MIAQGRHQKFRGVIQVFFLTAFIMLLVMQRPQLWLIVFGIAGIGLSLVFGRIFCAYVCPMGTLLRLQTWIYSKLKIPRIKNERMLNSAWLRWFILAAAAALLVFTRSRGMDIPLLPGLTAAAVLISLVMHESFWHRTLCPFGTILSVSSRVSSRGTDIHEDSCIACGKCQRVCPSLSIEGRNSRYNRNHECLACRACIPVCPKESIAYGKIRQR